MQTESLKELRGSCALFASLTDSELKIVLGLIQEKKVKAGTYIVHEGTEGLALYGLKQGSVGVVKETDESKPKITDVLPGNIFGELAYMRHAARSAGIVANEDVVMFELKYEDLEKIAEKHPELGLKLYRTIASTMGNRVRDTTDSLVTLMSNTRASALDELSHAISHEINNPLTSVMLNADLISKNLKESAPNHDYIGARAEKIKEVVFHIVKVITGLKAFVHQGDEEPLMPVPLRKIVRDTLEICGEKLKQHGIEVKLENLTPDLIVKCRAVQVSQALMNLLMNAADAIETQESKWIQIEAVESPDAIELRIQDSGPGIQPGIVNYLFQPFFTTKRKKNGTGLGLSLSRKLIESQAGTLELRSHTPTEFVIRLLKP